jgi:hypothetical protein
MDLIAGVRAAGSGLLGLCSLSWFSICCLAAAFTLGFSSCTIENANFSVQGATIHQEPVSK